MSRVKALTVFFYLPDWKWSRPNEKYRNTMAVAVVVVIVVAVVGFSKIAKNWMKENNIKIGFIYNVTTICLFFCFCLWRLDIYVCVSGHVVDATSKSNTTPHYTCPTKIQLWKNGDFDTILHNLFCLITLMLTFHWYVTWEKSIGLYCRASYVRECYNVK